MPSTSRIIQSALATVAIAVSLVFYLHIAKEQATVNDNPSYGDQRAYMTFTTRAYESRLQETGARSRMPLYPWVQALLYSPELSEEQFFERGKRINVIMSVVCLAVLGIAFFATLSKLYASYSLLVIAFLLFALKAPWLQAELLYYTLFGLAFILAVESIRRPKWYKSVAVGVLFALAHFTKFSALPALVIYTGSFLIALAGKCYRRSLYPREVLRALAFAIAPAGLFLVLLYPYFRESKERYGQYLYNVNTTFYMWYDSWDEARAGVRAAGARRHWPDLPDDQIPSLGKYLAEHSTEEIIHRLWIGFYRYADNTCTRLGSQYLLGNCLHISVGLIVMLVNLAVGVFFGLRIRRLCDAQAVVFMAVCLILYVLSAFWFWPINNGPRIIYAVLIPLFWTMGIALKSAGPSWPETTLFGFVIKPLDALYGFMILVTLYQVYELAAFRAATLFGGN